MKKFSTFVFVLSFVFYMNSVSTVAQGRGIGQGPAVTGGHAPDINHSTDHGKSADHSKSADQANHEQTNAPKSGNFIDRINGNPQLSSRLTALLPQVPQPGTPWTLETAAMGFKNQGQFIAFLHVSKNLNLTLDEWTTMRTKMTTGESLGQALHEVKPSLPETQLTVEVQKAESQAKEDQKIKTPKTTS